MKPKKKSMIGIKVDEEMRTRMEAQAEEEHRTLSEFIRHCVLNYLEKVDEVKRITGKP